MKRCCYCINFGDCDCIYGCDGYNQEFYRFSITQWIKIQLFYTWEDIKLWYYLMFENIEKLIENVKNLIKS
jgi:hypothetical protein